MQDASEILTANKLATAFRYAELHCTLLLRHIGERGGLPPRMPSLDSEKALIETLADFIDDISLIELNATLRTVSLAFSRMQVNCPKTMEDNVRPLEAARARLGAARDWLEKFAEEGLSAPLTHSEWSAADIGLSNIRAPEQAKQGSL